MYYALRLANQHQEYVWAQEAARSTSSRIQMSVVTSFGLRQSKDGLLKIRRDCITAEKERQQCQKGTLYFLLFFSLYWLIFLTELMVSSSKVHMETALEVGLNGTLPFSHDEGVAEEDWMDVDDADSGTNMLDSDQEAARLMCSFE
jgi:hypothetical protein